MLPTAADILEFDDVMAAGIGNWQDNSAVASGSKRRPARQPMAKHYADDKVRTSGEHKRWLVWALVETMRRGARAEGPTLWEQLRVHDFPLEMLANNSKKFACKAPRAPEEKRDDREPSVERKLREDSWYWFLQFPPRRGGQRPRLHLSPGPGVPPFCKNSTFQAKPYREGWGLKDASLTGERLCDRCINAAPDLYIKEAAKRYFRSDAQDGDQPEPTQP